MVSKMCRRVGRPLPSARWTEPPILAGKGHQQLIVASSAADAGEAVAEEFAAQVALKFGANEARQFTAGIALLRFGEEGSQIFADDAMEQSLFGLATPVADPRTDRRAEPRGLFCGTRAHQPPPSTAGARLPPRHSASATRNPGELWSSDLPDAVCVSDTAPWSTSCADAKTGRLLGERSDCQSMHFVRRQRT